jgi:uncharacterized protein (TIGR02266 family)
MITRESKKILVADDSLFFRIKLSDILIEAGHLVSLSKNGKETIEEIKIDSNGVDLLILDLQMPEVDGFGVLEWINDNGHRGRFPILALTGVYEASKVLKTLRGLGADGFMSKDMSPEQIIFRVNKFLFPEKSAGRIEEKRVYVSIPVDFTVGDNTYTGFLLNASEGGAFLHTNVKIPKGAECLLTFSLPGSARLMSVKGCVQWSSDVKAEKAIFCGYGIKFSSMSMEDQDELKAFVREKGSGQATECDWPGRLKKSGTDN